MNTTEILGKIKTLLSGTEEVKLASAKLEDGITIVESENFEAGDEVVIISEDGKVALPKGEYTLEDGKKFRVEEDGIIAEVIGEEKEEEVAPENPEVEEEVDASNEPASPKKIVESVSKESYFSEIEKLKSEIEALKAEKEELSKEEVVEEKEEKKEEVKEEVELSKEEEVEPIVYNPENKEDVKLKKTFSPKRQRNIMDSVFSKLANK